MGSLRGDGFCRCRCVSGHVYLEGVMSKEAIEEENSDADNANEG